MKDPKNPVFLKYGFLFDADSMPWRHLDDFERDLGEFFTSKGLQAKVVKTLDEQKSERIVWLCKKPEVLTMPEDTQVGIKESLSKLAPTRETSIQKKFKEGKYLVRKGYLKKENG